MKVCIIHDSNSLGGASISLLDISKMLSVNYEVIVCVPNDSKKVQSLFIGLPITLYFVKSLIPRFSYYSGSKPILSRTVLKQILSLLNNRKFAREINQLNPDVVIFNSIVTTLSAKYLLPGIIKIGFVRETIKRTFISNVFKKNFESNFQGVCFIANYDKEYFNLARPITAVIPDCLNPDSIETFSRRVACKQENLDDNQKYVLFLGGLDPIKGLKYILSAMLKVKSKCVLLIAGNFDIELLSITNILKYIYNPVYSLYLLKIRNLYNQLVTKDRVIAVGIRRSVSALFICSEFLVFPSKFEHQSRPSFEAGEYKKTVLISNFKATREYFINNHNVLTFKPRSSIDLAEKIDFLLTNKQVMDKLGNQNYLMSRNLHNYSETQAKLQHFLFNLIKK